MPSSISTIPTYRQKLAELKRQDLAASINVERAIASLDKAKLNYQKQQHEYGNNNQQYQT